MIYAQAAISNHRTQCAASEATSIYDARNSLWRPTGLCFGSGNLCSYSRQPAAVPANETLSALAQVARNDHARHHLSTRRLTRMCTVTLIARRNGYALGMNRDEKLTRAIALPSARHRLGNCNALFPSEPNGGTWIGVNDAGATLALINWYSVDASVRGQSVSRGEVVKLALATDSHALTDAALA
jgi:hypothetical protein